jgi:O-antigen/teichoic acid export membrane protein
MLVIQGDYLTMGFFHGQQVVGLFYFAFNLSTQTYVLLSLNLGGVLFPALSRLNAERPRQVDAFVRAGSAFAAITIPICLLQAALIAPGIRLLFPKWEAVIPVLELLSIAMAMRTASVPAAAMAASQGRFRFNLMVIILGSIVFLSSVALAAWLSSDSRAPQIVAATEAGFFIVYDITYLGLMLRINGRSGSELWAMWLRPLIGGGIAASAGWAAIHFISPASELFSGKIGQIALLAIGTSVFASIYLPLLRRTSPAIWNDLLSRLRKVI